VAGVLWHFQRVATKSQIEAQAKHERHLLPNLKRQRRAIAAFQSADARLNKTDSCSQVTLPPTSAFSGTADLLPLAVGNRL